MNAGPALDKLVAIHVMGWHKHHSGGSLYVWADDTNHRTADYHDSDCCDCLTDFPRFSPSTLLTDAWRVVDRVKALTGGALLVIDRNGGAQVSWSPFLHTHNCSSSDKCGHDGIFIGTQNTIAAPTVPHAICLAALAVVDFCTTCMNEGIVLENDEKTGIGGASTCDRNCTAAKKASRKILDINPIIKEKP